MGGWVGDRLSIRICWTRIRRGGRYVLEGRGTGCREGGREGGEGLGVCVCVYMYFVCFTTRADLPKFPSVIIW